MTIKIGPKLRKALIATSVTSGILIVVSAYAMFGLNPAFDEVIFLATIVSFSPLAFMSYLDYKWRKAIDEHLPDLFRSIVQAQETGMTLPQALEEASKRDYGPLTAEMKKMTAQISWGMSFEDALVSMSDRVNTVLVRRTIPMIIEASRSGGHVEKVFDPLGKFIQTTLLLDKERRTQTRPYIAIIYVAFFVFLFTIVLLFRSFFTSVEGLPILANAVMSPTDMQRLFFRMTGIQAFFGGLIAGKMGDGSVIAGLKHCLILLICGYVALKLFI